MRSPVHQILVGIHNDCGTLTVTDTPVLAALNPMDSELTSLTTNYAYDGLGNRYSQTVDSETTEYLLDLNRGLTQVLGETRGAEETWYLLGLDVIAQQQDTDWSYFAADGLGSARQTYDSSGAVDYAVSFDPYGLPFENHVGGLNTDLGFTGERTDDNGLVFLRARYYTPGLGVLLSKDPFEGVMDRVMSRNGYGYAEANPVNIVDPSGQFSFLAAAFTAIISAPAALIIGAALLTIGGLCIVTGCLETIHNLIDSLQRDIENLCPPVTNPIPERVEGTENDVVEQAERIVEDLFQQPGEVDPNDEDEPGPQPDPGQGPGRDPGPPPPPPPDKPSRKDISLGLNWPRGEQRPLLWMFTYHLNQRLNPQNIYVYRWGDWFQQGLTSIPGFVTTNQDFATRFYQAAAAAGHIHFNLESMEGDYVEYSESMGGQGDIDKQQYMTAWELYIIRTTGLCSKTTFYQNGSTDPQVDAEAWSRICGAEEPG